MTTDDTPEVSPDTDATTLLGFRVNPDGRPLRTLVRDPKISSEIRAPARALLQRTDAVSREQLRSAAAEVCVKGLANPQPCAEGPGGGRVGTAAYRPAVAQLPSLHPPTLVTDATEHTWLPFMFRSPLGTEIRFRGQVQRRQGAPTTGSDLNDYIFRSEVTGQRIYVPGQTGYHAWHQGLGELGDCPPGAHCGSGGFCVPGDAPSPSLAVFGLLSPDRVAQYTDWLTGTTADHGTALLAAEALQRDALEAARSMLQQGLARVWHGVLRDNQHAAPDAPSLSADPEEHADPQQWNIEWVHHGSHGGKIVPRLVRVAIDPASGIVLNWLVLDARPGAWFFRFRQTLLTSPLMPDRATFNAAHGNLSWWERRRAWRVLAGTWSMDRVPSAWGPPPAPRVTRRASVAILAGAAALTLALVVPPRTARPRGAQSVDPGTAIRMTKNSLSSPAPAEAAPHRR